MLRTSLQDECTTVGDGTNLRPVFVVGFPGDVGGANTECWHTAALWRQFGLDVTFLPTSDPEPQWRQRVEALGCRVFEWTPNKLRHVPGLPGSVVVSFCNTRFLREARRFRDLGCRVVWVGCMNWLFPEERKHYQACGPFDAYVFQSDFQRSTLLPELQKHGVTASQCHLVRGAFRVEEYEYRPRPHRAGESLVVGRISRPAPDKFSVSTWAIYRRIPHPIRARVMAWDVSLARKLGEPPPWAECLPAAQETPQEFFGKLHRMIQVNGGAQENWPRSGLEAMACGVSVVAENRWGWREMIAHGVTGYLADTDDELAFYAAKLAYDEGHRLEIAGNARRALEQQLANPQTIWAAWRRLFEEIQ